jgi:hypothetical protein
MLGDTNFTDRLPIVLCRWKHLLLCLRQQSNCRWVHSHQFCSYSINLTHLYNVLLICGTDKERGSPYIPESRCSRQLGPTPHLIRKRSFNPNTTKAIPSQKIDRY